MTTLAVFVQYGKNKGFNITGLPEQWKVVNTQGPFPNKTYDIIFFLEGPTNTRISAGHVLKSLLVSGHKAKKVGRYALAPTFQMSWIFPPDKLIAYDESVFQYKHIAPQPDRFRK